MANRTKALALKGLAVLLIVYAVLGSIAFVRRLIGSNSPFDEGRVSYVVGGLFWVFLAAACGVGLFCVGMQLAQEDGEPGAPDIGESDRQP
ncbi:MAG: hypothetical protein GY711_34855 [bacterium]|nr:hypothetical protein [bacterium]